LQLYVCQSRFVNFDFADFNAQAQGWRVDSLAATASAVNTKATNTRP
jgi:hypothetical protein